MDGSLILITWISLSTLGSKLCGLRVTLMGKAETKTGGEPGITLPCPEKRKEGRR